MTVSAGAKPNPLVALTPGLYIWTIITFLLLLYVLAKFAWKPLLKMLEDRENLIKSSLKDAEKAKLELESLTQESEAITAKARSEAQSILAESKSAAEKVKEDTIAKAKEQAIKIRDDAKKQIEVEKDKAISDKWRNYSNSEESRHLANNIEPEVISALVNKPSSVPQSCSCTTRS